MAESSRSASTTPSTVETAGACCAAYSRGPLALLLGESWHPGGLPLTRRLASGLGLLPGARVLDLACGRGATLRLLASEFKWGAVGLDALRGNLARNGNGSALCAGDARRLPFGRGVFDGAVSECFLSTLRGPGPALGELSRVLRPGGRLGISDVVREGPLPKELEGELADYLCLEGALPVQESIRRFEEAGFAEVRAEDATHTIRALVDGAKKLLLLAEVLLATGRPLPFGSAEVERAKGVVRGVEEAVADGRLGYALLWATKP